MSRVATRRAAPRRGRPGWRAARAGGRPRRRPRLLAEGRKNQCSFKTDSDDLAPGCEAKLKNLANALISAKKRLNAANLKNFKFEVVNALAGWWKSYEQATREFHE